MRRSLDVIIVIPYPRSPVHQRESTASVRSKALNGINPSLKRQDPQPPPTPSSASATQKDKEAATNARHQERRDPFSIKRLPDCSVYRHALFHIQYSAAYSTVNVFGIPSQLLGGWPPAVLTL